MSLSGFFSGRTILVTGASSGLGREMARKLAVDHGARVIATARRREKLAALQREVEAAGGALEPYAFDVTDAGAMPGLVLHCADAGVDMIVLNAGITYAGAFVAGDAAGDAALVATNVSANVQLLRQFIPQLSGKPDARILLVASMGGLVPLPYQAVYSGTKAFVVNYGLALREELKPSGITVSVFAPGGIATEMTQIAAMDNVRGFLAPVGMVADVAIGQLKSRRALVVPGLSNKLGLLALRALPRGALSSMIARQYRKK